MYFFGFLLTYWLCLAQYTTCKWFYIPQGSVPALTALGWYFEQYEKDYEKAVHLWEEADAKGHPDAAMNLGVFYSQGLYPGEPADQVKNHTLVCF